MKFRLGFSELNSNELLLYLKDLQMILYKVPFHLFDFQQKPWKPLFKVFNKVHNHFHCRLSSAHLKEKFSITS